MKKPTSTHAHHNQVSTLEKASLDNKSKTVQCLMDQWCCGQVCQTQIKILYSFFNLDSPTEHMIYLHKKQSQKKKDKQLFPFSLFSFLDLEPVKAIWLLVCSVTDFDEIILVLPIICYTHPFFLQHITKLGAERG